MSTKGIVARAIPLFVAFALGLVVAACAGGGEKPTPTSAPVPTPTPTLAAGPTTPAPTATPIPTPTPTLPTRATPTPAPSPAATPTPTPTPTPVPSPTPTPRPAPSPTPTPAAPPKVWRIGLLADVSSTNIWDILGPNGTAWNFYVFKNRYPTLYGLSDFHFSWVPVLAKGKPSELKQEGNLWTIEVELKEGVKWSDGVEITAQDVAFTVNTALELQLPGSWLVLVDPNFVKGAEALDSRRVKFSFKEKPGLARWEYGLSQTVVVAKHYWEPVVAQARRAGSTIEEQQKSLFGHEPAREPTAGEMSFNKREPGAFVEMKRNPNYYWSGSTVKEYPNGAYVEEKPGVFRFQAYGEPLGEPSLTVKRGPNADSIIFSVYEDQNAAVIALRSDQIDYILGPQGIAPALRKHLQGRNIATFENPQNGFNFLGFNLRRPPMDSRVFRHAVAILIDKEFITNVVLQGNALPLYTLVPEGNKFWSNPNVSQLGRDLTREQRINQAVALLKGAGYTWEVEPKWDEEKRAVKPGKGLKMPDGPPVPQMELLSLSAGYDPMRATAAIWIEAWLNEAGIPVKANFTGFNEIIPRVLLEQDFDMWILGRGLAPLPSHLVDLFHSDQAAPGGLNPGGYQNPDFDKIASEFLAETDLARARQKAFQLQEFLADELPMVTLFNIPIIETYRGDLLKWAFTEVLDGVQAYFPSINGALSYTVIQ